jgi:hypothetical protein
MKLFSKQAKLFKIPFASHRVCAFCLSLFLISLRALITLSQLLFKLLHASSRADQRVVDNSFTEAFIIQYNN